RKEESIRVVETVKNLLSGNWCGNEIEPLQPHEIGIFYPRMLYKDDRATIENLIENLHLYAPTIWLSDRENLGNRYKVSHPGIKIQTIHSAKGLQYRAVILMWADRLPKYRATPEQIDRDRKLLYVGLTRPEDFLFISSSGTSKFVSQIENSGKVYVPHFYKNIVLKSYNFQRYIISIIDS
ncbi:3'-5' exonuclease, partial [Anaplasma marginale]|uniref:3'-5' exonuclease n=1 Tax=Anaplasma marginale TaxID=770 RepID=UPI0005B32A2B